MNINGTIYHYSTAKLGHKINIKLDENFDHISISDSLMCKLFILITPRDILGVENSNIIIELDALSVGELSLFSVPVRVVRSQEMLVTIGNSVLSKCDYGIDGEPYIRLIDENTTFDLHSLPPKPTYDTIHSMILTLKQCETEHTLFTKHSSLVHEIDVSDLIMDEKMRLHKVLYEILCSTASKVT